MDLTSTIIGVTILILFLLPVYLINRVNRNKRIRLIKKLELQAKTEDVNLTESDVWDDSVIGIDTEKGKIIYITEGSGEDRLFVFNINDLKSFRTIPASGIIEEKTKEGMNKNERISLIFSFSQKGKPDLVIDIHLPGFGKIPDREKKIFEKWSRLVKGLLSHSNSL